MKMVCMYCKKKYGNKLKLAPGLPKGAVSHGICPECEPRANKELDLFLANYKENKK